MKRLFNLLSVLLIASLCMMTLNSCEEQEPSYGLTSLKMTTLSGQEYTFEIDQATLTVDNTADPVPVYTQEADLKSCTISFTATLDAVVSLGETDIPTNSIQNVDMTQPFTIKVSFAGEKKVWSKNYTVNMIIGEVSEDLKKGVRMSANLRAGGIPENLTDYDVAYLDGKFYMNTCGYNAPTEDGDTDGTGYYHIYTSINGTQWTKVQTDTIAVGAVGARSVAYNGKIYILGGTRSWGKDEDGNLPETKLTWGTLGYTTNHLKIFSSTDFTTVTDLTRDTSFVNADGSEPVMMRMYFKMGMAPVNYGITTVHNGKIFYKAGLQVMYGQMQGNINSLLHSTNGKDWKDVNPAENASGMRKDAAFFSFKNKLWMVGGFANFVGANNVKNTSIYSEDDGATWTETEAGDLAIFGAKGVVNKSGTTAYLFGGEYYNTEGTLVPNDKVYKSTDGLTWTAIEVKEGYTGRRSPAVVVDDNNIAWVFGRYVGKLGNYGYTPVIDETKENILYDVWAFALDE